MYFRILQLLLAATLVLNAVGAPWAMAAMSHSMGHPPSHSEPVAIADPAMQDHGHHDMHHSQMAAETNPTDDTTTAHPENAGACCNGTTCHCGCVLPPALLFAPMTQLAQFVTPTPDAVSVQRSQALPSTPPFRPPSV